VAKHPHCGSLRTEEAIVHLIAMVSEAQESADAVTPDSHGAPVEAWLRNAVGLAIG